MIDVDTHRRERLDGLAGNPAIPADLLRRLVDERLSEVAFAVSRRSRWTEEQFATLAGHPDEEVRALLARALRLGGEQRMRLVEDESRRVLHALAEGPEYGRWTWRSEPGTVLPAAGFERLLTRLPSAGLWLADAPWVPAGIRERVAPAWPEKPLSRSEAEALASSGDVSERLRAAGDPGTPADVVARLARDPRHAVRLAVSMRPELTEEQRMAVDFTIGADDRISVARWAHGSRDPRIQRRSALSAHVGLRRTAAQNPHLDADLVAELATDDDPAVRLFLCECHPGAPADLVLAVYLGQKTMRSWELLEHPSLIGFPFAGYPDPAARALVARDPGAPAHLVERLSHDPDVWVRRAMAADPRLSAERLRELFDDAATTAAAARNPNLPETVMRQIVGDTNAAATISP